MKVTTINASTTIMKLVGNFTHIYDISKLIKHL